MGIFDSCLGCVDESARQNRLQASIYGGFNYPHWFAIFRVHKLRFLASCLQVFGRVSQSVVNYGQVEKDNATHHAPQKRLKHIVVIKLLKVLY